MASVSEVDKSSSQDAATSDASKVDAMKVDELKVALKKRKLKTYGNKVDLVARLKAAMVLDDEREDEDDENEEPDENADFTVMGQLNEVADSPNSSEENAEKCSDKVKYALTFKDVEESLEAFSGDKGISVSRWIAEFEDTADLCDWNNVQRIIYAKRLLRGSAKIFVNFEKCTKTWLQLKNALKEEFAHKVNSHQIHKDLCRRKKRPDESYHQYIYAMIEIASQANVELCATIQYIIDGINDEESNKSLLYGATSIRELKTKFDLYETMKSNTRMKQRHAENARKVTPSNPAVVKRCFNCGEKDHVSFDCPARSKGAKCFRCNDYGHISSKCPNNKNGKKDSCNATQAGQKKYEKEVDVQGNKIIALIDTGSDISLIRSDVYIRIGAPRLEKHIIQFRGVGSDNNITLGRTCVEITMDRILYKVAFHVVSDTLMQQDMLIGSDFLNTVDVHLNQGNVTISEIVNADTPEVFKIDITEEYSISDLTHVNDTKYKEELDDVIRTYTPNKTREVAVKMQLILKDDIPIYQRPRRLSPQELHEVDTQIQAWISEGIVRPSLSEYTSPIVLVKKKDGSTRICVDYRKLNEKVVKDRYPLPLIEEQIDRLQGAKIYSTIDLRNGFFHVPLENDSVKYTSFVVPNGQYEFLRMPFGLCNAPSVFQKFINAVFKESIANGTTLAYMDDLIVPASDYEDAISRLKSVLITASEHGLEINWKKCRFLQTKIQYLGYTIEGGNISPSDEKTIAVKRFPKPSNIKMIQSFLGLTGYFRKFVPKYSIIARPLTNLLKNDVKFKFEENEELAFNHLKTILVNKPVLKLYRINAETELHTDASMLGYGAILLQRDDVDQMFHPIFYASSKTTPAEEKYTSYELEVLAIVKALRKFRVYLLGIRFTIVTDCQAFAMTMKKKDLCVRVARWALLLSEFDYAVEHRPGRSMTHVDALSRNPIPAVMFTERRDEGILLKFKQAQISDEELKKILATNEQKQAVDYVVKNGLIYKEINNELLLVVPKAMQSEIIRRAHNRGHFAVGKVEKIIKRDYWFSGMRPKNRRTYNKKRKRPNCYKQDDLVAIKRTQLGPGLKLHQKFWGPYRISKVLRNDRYLVEKVGEHEGPHTTSTAVDYMKPWAAEVSDCDERVSVNSESETEYTSEDR